MKEPLTLYVGSTIFSAFQGKDGKWRWHAATSGEPFASEGNAERAMSKFVIAMGATWVEMRG